MSQRKKYFFFKGLNKYCNDVDNFIFNKKKKKYEFVKVYLLFFIKIKK